MLPARRRGNAMAEVLLWRKSSATGQTLIPQPNCPVDNQIEERWWGGEINCELVRLGYQNTIVRFKKSRKEGRLRGYRGLREKLKTCNLLACHCGKRA